MLDARHTHGNADVVAALEQMLSVARKGTMGYAAFFGVDAGGKATAWFGGSEHLLRPAHEGIGKLGGLMEERIAERARPPLDPDLDASHVCYNVPSAPVSYDFIAWLVDAEMTRIREGAPAPLKVAFAFGRNGKTGLDMPSRRQMFDHVVRPSLALIGAVEDPRALGGRFDEHYLFRFIVEAARRGEQVPVFRAPRKPPTQLDGVVTITLREAEHWPHRNSDLHVWTRFARWLEECGERVVFVRDTAFARDPLMGFDTVPVASTDLIARMALYERARCNLFVANGPATLAYFGLQPWISFIPLQPDSHPYSVETVSGYPGSMGLAAGEQFPWASPRQRIVNAPATFDGLVQAWGDVMG